MSDGVLVSDLKKLFEENFGDFDPEYIPNGYFQTIKRTGSKDDPNGSITIEDVLSHDALNKKVLADEELRDGETLDVVIYTRRTFTNVTYDRHYKLTENVKMHSIVVRNSETKTR